MKHFKKIACFLMAAAMCLSLTACMNADAPQSTTRTETVPEASAAPSATNGAAVTQQPVAFDWLTGSGTAVPPSSIPFTKSFSGMEERRISQS